MKNLVTMAGLEGNDLPEVQLPRASVNSPEVREKIFKYMACGKSFEAACGLMGVSAKTFKKKIENSEDLKEQYEIADQLRIAWLEDFIYNCNFPPLIAVTAQFLKASGSSSYTGITPTETQRVSIVEIKKTIVDGPKVIENDTPSV